MNQLLDEIIRIGRNEMCSDVHIGEGEKVVYRKNGELRFHPVEYSPQEIVTMIYAMMNNHQIKMFERGKDIDFVFVTSDMGRQRVNVYRAQKRRCAAIRIINDSILTLDQLYMPYVIKKLAMQPRGLILLTGPTGSGKSTTLAAMIEYINEQRNCHILTIEDPIEYVYKQKNAMIHQREIGDDVDRFDEALRSVMREDPDVILVGEMRDYETVQAVITLAETGHLVLSTLHTIGAANTVDRIIDVFPPHKQEQIRTQLAGILNAVITQQLLPNNVGGRIAALEIMIGNDAVRNLIRENKGHQLGSIMQTGLQDGMQSLNYALAELIRNNRVNLDVAERFSNDVRELHSYLKR